MTTQQFIFEEPLYKRVSLSDNPHLLKELMGKIHVDGYNAQRGVDSTYELKAPLYVSPVGEYESSTEQIVFACLRYGDRLFVQVHYDRKEDFIEKVGQYPSVADIAIAQIKQYSKVLDKQHMKDFTRAIGLAANGIGTGSFVYLRRIFEHLVDEMSRDAIARGELEEVAFKAGTMDKRLKMLENQLPDVMKDNKPLYGVLSKGIHELSEENCLEYFTVVREIIELILDEREFDRQRREKKKQAQNKLSQIVSEVK